MKLLQHSSTLPLLTLGLVLIAVTHQASAGVVQPDPYYGHSQSQTMNLSYEEGKRLEKEAQKAAEKETKKQERQAAREAEKAARQAEREAQKAGNSAETSAEREARKAAKAAEKAAEREANKTLNAAEREAKKAARQAARDAKKAAKQEGRNLETSTKINLDNPECLAAINQCSLFDAVESEMKPMWERTTLQKELKTVYKQRKDDLRRLKKYINQLVDYTIENPAADQPLLGLCDGATSGRDGSDEDGDDLSPATADPSYTADPSTTADPWTKSSETPAPTADPWTGPTTVADRCVVSEWSDWSAPLGFGTQERTRYIVQSGIFCPEDSELIEERDIPSEKNGDGEYVVDDVDLVTNNFEQDFIRANDGKPRDLLLVLDSSGSITDEDFEALKDGVKVLIDSLCGGFGPASNQHRLGVVQFSTFTRPVHSFADAQDPASLKDVVDNTRPMYGYTCTGDALGQAFDEFDASRGARDYTVHDTLIITDGKSNCGADLLMSSQTLQQRSNVYALAIGLSSDQAARNEITSVVSDNDPGHLFSLANFLDFQDMVHRVQDRYDASQCQDIVVNP
ncbi:uncharacterized protein [Littorina saxatilis]|uniref:VWFA domain-containing protein n=1 Tax=Littorina saxatilis TaxID=31220 RepID=A0AAN9BM31_9CAEN